MKQDLLEISDLIVDYDRETLRRVPVDKQSVVDRLLAVRDRRAARIVQRMPDIDGIIDPDYVDRLLVRVHCEMQRLSEEFQHGRRVYELLQTVVAALGSARVPPPYRIVDVGCGSGFVIRWLAAHARFNEDVELLGVDFNEALVDEANRLAGMEQLNCSFEVANAFELARPANVLMSTGVVHHFRGNDLTSFFQQHDQPAVHAFLHFDFQPNPLAGPGAWLFHYIRMRKPLSRHDGVVSALRAHTTEALSEAAVGAGFQCGIYSARFWRTPMQRVFHTLIGLRSPLIEPFQAELGARRGRWEPTR